MRPLPLVTATLAMAVVPAGLQAQTTSAPSNMLVLNQLQTPVSPAFVILGVSPSAVERPTSPQALAVSLLSATGSGSLLPDSYALEVAPYWLTPHPDLTYDAYYDPTFGRGILQSLSISAATAPLQEVGDSLAGTAFGIGARWQLVTGRPSPELTAREEELRKLQSKANTATLDIDDAQRLSDVLDSLDVRARSVALEMQSLDQERVGWIVEAAAAAAFSFPQNRTDSADIRRIGAWFTAGYRLPEPSLDLVGVARYERAYTPVPARNLVGVGLRLAWTSQELTLSFEYLERLGDRTSEGRQPGYRAAGNLEYRVPGVGRLTATLGTDDDQVGRPKLVSTIGIDLGFGTIPIQLPMPAR